MRPTIRHSTNTHHIGNRQNAMNKSIPFILLIVLSCFALIGISNKINHPSTSQKIIQPVTYSLYNQDEHPFYAEAWKNILDFESKRLPKTALELAENILLKARIDGLIDQEIKALDYIAKFTAQTEEEGIIISIARLQTEFDNASFPTKNLLAVLLTTYYNSYIQTYFWEIDEITVGAEDENDIRTWSSDYITTKSLALYELALKDYKRLQLLPAETLRAILKLEGGDILQLLEYDVSAYNYRPTVFDIIAHSALSYFTNAASLKTPTNRFEIKEDEAFQTNKEFISYKWNTPDSLSVEYKSIVLYQALSEFHLARIDKAENELEKSTYKTALVLVTLDRLSYIKEKAFIENKEQKYIAACEKLLLNNQTLIASGDIRHALAQAWYSRTLFISVDDFINNPDDERFLYRKKAVELCEESIRLNPENTVGRSKCEALLSTINKPSLIINTTQASLPSENILAACTYKNLDAVYLRVLEINEAILTLLDSDLDNIEKGNELAKLPSIKEWNLNLPSSEDHFSHRTEFSINPLNLGSYLLLASNNEIFAANKSTSLNCWTTLQITDISTISTYRKDGLELFILSRSTGRAIENANIVLHAYHYNRDKRTYEKVNAGAYKSDKTGRVFIKKAIHSERITIEVTHKEDKYLDGNNIHIPRAENEVNREYILGTVFTDRAIYRPGQTIHFKGILYDQKGEKFGKVVPNKNVTVSLRDYNEQEVDVLILSTNQYGSFSGTFIASTSGITGSWSIITQYSHTEVLIEEYKRPKFEIDFKPLTGTFEIGDEILLSGFAKAYSGANISEASVKYRVYRETVWPWWCYFIGFNPPSTSNEEVANGSTSTDEDGIFKIVFTARPSLDAQSTYRKYSPDYRYRIDVDVTDLSGETRSGSTAVTVNNTSFNLKTDWADKIDKQKDNQLIITAENGNGDDIKTSGEITIYKIDPLNRLIRKRYWGQSDQFIIRESEFKTLFPKDEYKNETDPESRVNYEAGKGIELQETFKSNEPIKLPLKKWDIGEYLIVVSSKDKNGKEVSFRKHFSLFDSKSKSLSPDSYFSFESGQMNIQPGQNARYRFGIPLKGIPYLYEVRKGDEIIERRWLISNGQMQSFELPVKEDYRGGLDVEFVFVLDNRKHQHKTRIKIPWTNKELKVEMETWRDLLKPGAKEEWRVKVSGAKGELIAAELLAGMYDASLDVFKPHQWDFIRYPNNVSYRNWDASNSFQLVNAEFYPYYNSIGAKTRSLLELDFGSYINRRNRSATDYIFENVESMGDGHDGVGLRSIQSNFPKLEAANVSLNESEKEGSISIDQPVRTNLNETAFFFPKLYTDKEGNISFSFTTPEALTKWKFMALAHTPELEWGMTTQEIITQKELMIMPNFPRFFREGDQIKVTARIDNLSDTSLGGTAHLELYDALTMKPIIENYKLLDATVNWNANTQGSDAVSWTLSIPNNTGAVLYRVRAQSANFSDGEESVLPVLSNRMLVTETLPLPVPGPGTFTYELDKLKTNTSSSLSHHNLAVEFTSNPAWYAIQALPYLMEYPYDCAEQTFSRFYANSIATHVANSDPAIARVFEQWKGTEALTSNLEKNQNLKNLIIEETPWLRNAKDESTRKKRIGVLFDLNKMKQEQSSALLKLKQTQLSIGAWPWFKGGPESEYITRYIIAGMGHLDKLGIKDVKTPGNINSMVQNAIRYSDQELNARYSNLKSNKTNLKIYKPGRDIVHYLYARSFFNEVANSQESAFDYFKQRIKETWADRSVYEHGMIALAFYRFGEKRFAEEILASLSERAIQHPELGMYWKSNSGGWYWYQAPIETQALLIEAYHEIKNDVESVSKMQTWLLKQKQTTDWKTTKATAEACYALLSTGDNLLANTEIPVITIGAEILKVDGKTEAGTGYFRQDFEPEKITANSASVTISKSQDGIAWGAMYWQYFEDLDKITSADSPLSINKELYREVNGNRGPELKLITENNPIEIGDRLTVRVILTTDRDMEFVHLKDMRASGTEPINVSSSWKYKSGLGYYESTRDASTNFFFDRLAAGTWVFEYPLRAFQAGEFSSGIANVQCMYAPEFSSHSEGTIVTIK